MKCNLPRSYLNLPPAEKDVITELFNEELNAAISKEEAELQEIWIKLACINLHETFGFGEDRLNRFIAAWNRPIVETREQEAKPCRPRGLMRR